jgi:tetratricopeptide (TPR) repeat protein
MCLLVSLNTGLTAQVQDAEFQQGLEFFQQGRRREAISHLRAARPNSPALVLLGLSYLQEGFPLDAAETLDRAPALGPLAEKPALLLVQAWHDSFDFAKALARATDAVKRFPDSADAQFRFGYELETAGRFEEGERAYVRAVELRPQLAEAQLALGRIQLRAGRHEEALKHLEAAWRADPRRFEPRLELAKALYALKRYALAAELLDGLVAERDVQPEPHLWLSRIAQARADTAVAGRERVRFLELTRLSTEPGGMSANLPAHKLQRYVP